MTWPVSHCRLCRVAAPGRRAAAGFTLLEMIIVLVILGLVVGLVLARGPAGSRSLEVRAVASDVAQSLRGARARAIAHNENVRLVVDLTNRSYAVDGGRAHTLPAGMGLSVIAVTQETAGKRFAAIRFAPDGSSTGGTVELSEGARRVQIGVDWLTGRVSVADAR